MYRVYVAGVIHSHLNRDCQALMLQMLLWNTSQLQWVILFFAHQSQELQSFSEPITVHVCPPMNGDSGVGSPVPVVPLCVLIDTKGWPSERESGGARIAGTV